MAVPSAQASLSRSRLRLVDSVLTHTPRLRSGHAARIPLDQVEAVRVRRRPSAPILLLILPWLVLFLAAAENVWVQHQYRHRPTVVYDPVDVTAVLLLGLLLPVILFFALRVTFIVQTRAAAVAFKLRGLDRFRVRRFLRQVETAARRARKEESGVGSWVPFRA